MYTLHNQNIKTRRFQATILLILGFLCVCKFKLSINGETYLEAHDKKFLLYLSI